MTPALLSGITCALVTLVGVWINSRLSRLEDKLDNLPCHNGVCLLEQRGKR